ncbi:MAG TPA: universal stress protein [Xanthobacteraceae bacterium]|nr:universal stress protein [Xanthobacteraceae bacterium]
MKRIVVAVDGSPGAKRAIDVAASIAQATGAQLWILTIGGNMGGAQLRRLAETGGDISEALVKAAQKILKEAERRARRRGATDIKSRSEWGDPAETIIGVVSRDKADMVVLGRRGRGRLSGLLLGSVSQKVASLAPCAVLIVP